MTHIYRVTSYNSAYSSTLLFVKAYDSSVSFRTIPHLNELIPHFVQISVFCLQRIEHIILNLTMLVVANQSIHQTLRSVIACTSVGSAQEYDA